MAALGCAVDVRISQHIAPCGLAYADPVAVSLSPPSPELLSGRHRSVPDPENAPSWLAQLVSGVGNGCHRADVFSHVHCQRARGLDVRLPQCRSLPIHLVLRAGHGPDVGVHDERTVAMLPPADGRWLSDLGRGRALVCRERGLLFRGVATGLYRDGLPTIQTVCAPVANDGLLAGSA